MYDGGRSEIFCNTKFHENSYLSTNYLGRINRTMSDKITWRKDFLYQNKDMYSREIVRWYRMSNTLRYRSK